MARKIMENGVNRIATFFKKHHQLKFWDSKNTSTTHYCKGIHQARITLQMIEATYGIKQDLNISNS